VRRLPIWAQLGVAAGSYLVGFLLVLAFTAFGLWALDNGNVEQSELMGTPPEAETAAYLGTNEIGQRHGPWVSALRQRAITALLMHLTLAPFYFPAVCGMMMLGMVLTRTRIITGERSRAFYRNWALVLIPIGLALTLAIRASLGEGFRASFIWQSIAQGVGIPLGLGYGALVIWAAKTAALAPVAKALANVGRMALTNYIAHTVLCTTLFYGYGLGYFGQIEFPGLWLVILGVWAFNIVLSALWLRVFRFGPLEWVWRCATYGRLVPIRVKNP